MAVFLRATSSTSGDASWGAAPGGHPDGVIIVATAGGDYTTIEAALAVAVSGETVWVYPGTYTAPAAGWTIPDGVNLIGVDAQAVTLDCQGLNPAGSALTLVGTSEIQDLTILLGS